MGFWTKLKSFIKGQGWKDTIQENILKQKLKEAEQLSQPIQQQETTTQQTTEPLEEETTTQQTYEIKDKIRKQQSFQQYEQQINNNITNRIDSPTGIDTLNALRPQYERIIGLNDKIAKKPDGTTDEILMQILIENRQKLRHRFEAEIQIFSTTGIAGIVKIPGILIEDLQDLNQYITIGQSISPSTLQGQLNMLLQTYKNKYGAIGGQATVTENSKEIRITNIKAQMTFA